MTLLSKKLIAQINDIEVDQLDTWAKANVKNQEEIRITEQIWEASANYSPSVQFDSSKAFNKFKALHVLEPVNPTPAISTVAALLKWFAAAVSILVVAFGIYYFASNSANTIKADQIENIALDNGLAVWLDEDSELAIKENNETGSQVQLSGKAFFEHTDENDQSIAVNIAGKQLSTTDASFTVSDRSKESVVIDVMSGSVTISDLSNKHTVSTEASSQSSKTSDNSKANSTETSSQSNKTSDNSIANSTETSSQSSKTSDNSKANSTEASSQARKTSDNSKANPSEVGSSSSSSHEIIVSAGERVEIFNTGQIERTQRLTNNAFSWRAKTLEFNNTPLAVVFRDIEDYYDIKIDSGSNDISACAFTSPKLTNTKLEVVFDILKESHNIEFVPSETQSGSYILKQVDCNL